MKKHRSISYYARREKLRGILANATERRKGKKDAQMPANENRPVTAEPVSQVDSGAGHAEQHMAGERG